MSKQMERVIAGLSRKGENASEVSELAKMIRHDVGEAFSRGEIPNDMNRYKVIGDIAQSCIDVWLTINDIFTSDDS